MTARRGAQKPKPKTRAPLSAALLAALLVRIAATSRRDFARKARLHQLTVRRAIAGQTINIDTAKIIERALSEVSTT